MSALVNLSAIEKCTKFVNLCIINHVDVAFLTKGLHDGSLDDSFLSLCNCFNVSSQMDRSSFIGVGFTILISINLRLDIYIMSLPSRCNFSLAVDLVMSHGYIYQFVFFCLPSIGSVLNDSVNESIAFLTDKNAGLTCSSDYELFSYVLGDLIMLG